VKPVPRDPYALQGRIMSALMDDIADRNQSGFGRLDALRASAKAAREGNEK
jgi:hypothetical protein